jgi:aryl-alcohol dehydrogenase-like predicted oxidoreductase
MDGGTVRPNTNRIDDPPYVFRIELCEDFVRIVLAGVEFHHREEVVLATYTDAMLGRNANAGDNQHKSMVRAVEASLKRLGTITSISLATHVDR